MSAAMAYGPTRLTATENRDAPVLIKNPKRLPSAPITADRTPLGIPEDYKPWITKLKAILYS